MSTDLSALILAGGQSSRMGQDKALLMLQGRPLIRRVYDVAAACSDRVLVVTPWPKRYRPSLPTACRYVVEEASLPAQGPLVGFLRGLEAVETDWVLLLACDLPRLSPEAIQSWRFRLESLPEDVVALLPQRSNRWEPLCGFYRRSCRSSLHQFAESGGRSLQQWLRHQQAGAIHAIPLTDSQADLLYNCNTPEDWTQLQGFPRETGRDRALRSATLNQDTLNQDTLNQDTLS